MTRQKLDVGLLRDGAAYANQWVAYQQQRRDLPGVVAAVWGDDQLLLAQGYGYADLERQVAMTAGHAFRIASHSKTFTATAVLQLVERGMARLDDPLAVHLPWLPRRDGLERVTLRQALNHSSGIVRDGQQADYWQLEAPFPDVGELRRLVEDGGAVLAANEAFKYSNIAYGLLGLAIEQASGMPYNTYVKQNIVDRLGLSHTGPDTDAHTAVDLVTGYTARRLGLPRRPIPDVPTHALAAATGFYATAEDLCRYAAGHFLGNTILLSDGSKREMQQPYWKVAQSDDHYGLGFSVLDLDERRVIGHGGAFPGHATRTMFDPRDGLAVVVLTNEIGGPADTMARSIMKIVSFALKQSRQAAVPHANALDPFVGRFVNVWGVTDVAAFGETLVALNPDVDDPVAMVRHLVVDDEHTLRVTEGGGYGAVGETIRYTRDAAGRTSAIVAGGLSAYPLDIFRARRFGA